MVPKNIQGRQASSNERMSACLFLRGDYNGQDIVVFRKNK